MSPVSLREYIGDYSILRLQLTDTMHGNRWLGPISPSWIPRRLNVSTAHSRAWLGASGNRTRRDDGGQQEDRTGLGVEQVSESELRRERWNSSEMHRGSNGEPQAEMDDLKPSQAVWMLQCRAIISR